MNNSIANQHNFEIGKLIVVVAAHKLPEHKSVIPTYLTRYNPLLCKGTYGYVLCYTILQFF